MTCENFKEIINLLIDGELSENEKAQALEHVLICEQCRREYELYMALSAAVSGTQEAFLPQNFSDRVLNEATKGKVLSFWHKYNKYAAALVAAFAVVIFAVGVGDKHNIIDENVSPPAQSQALPETQFSAEIKEDTASAEQETPPIETASSQPRVSETVDAPPVPEAETVDAPPTVEPLLKESIPEAAALQSDIPAEPVLGNAEAGDVSDSLKRSAAPEDSADMAAPITAGSGSAMPFAAEISPEALAFDIKEIIESYLMPEKELFTSEELYNQLAEQLESIKARTCQPDADLDALYDELLDLENQIAALIN